MTEIYLDMDGLLVDLVGQILHEKTPIIDWSPGEYNLNRVFGFDDQYWHNLAENWWSSLPKTKEADAIVDICKAYGYIRIATMPINFVAIRGKFKWLKRYYPEIQIDDMFFVDTKHNLAQPDRILIDDCDKNCDNWIKFGGQAFLYPRYWNRRHKENRENNLKKLQTFLAKAVENDIISLDRRGL